MGYTTSTINKIFLHMHQTPKQAKRKAILKFFMVSLLIIGLIVAGFLAFNFLIPGVISEPFLWAVASLIPATLILGFFSGLGKDIYKWVRDKIFKRGLSAFKSGEALIESAKNGNTYVFSDSNVNDITQKLHFLSVADNEGKNALMVAIEYGHYAIVKAILTKWICYFPPEEQNMFLKLTDNDGNTALHLALLRGQINIAELLIINNFPTDIVNKNGDTPIDILKKRKERDQESNGNTSAFDSFKIYENNSNEIDNAFKLLIQDNKDGVHRVAGILYLRDTRRISDDGEQLSKSLSSVSFSPST